MLKVFPTPMCLEVFNVIEAEVIRNQEVIISTVFKDSTLSLTDAISKLEMYIVKEKLNEVGECNIRVRFAKV